MVERRRGDLVFVSSDVAVRPRPFMAAYAASKWGLEGLAQSMQMELEGTGVRASIVRPGPTWSEMGSTWDDQDAADVLEPVGAVRAGAAPALPQARGARRRDRHDRHRAARRAPEPGRSDTRGPGGGPMTIDGSAHRRRSRESRGSPDDPHGHLQELRTDPIGLLHRVREECGDIGRFRLADRDVVLVSRRRGQRGVLPGTRTTCSTRRRRTRS